MKRTWDSNRIINIFHRDITETLHSWFYESNSWLTHLLSVTKNRSNTLPSGVVVTFTFWMVSSSSESTFVTSTTIHKHNQQRQLEQTKHTKHDFKRHCFNYRVTTPFDQGNRISTDRQEKIWKAVGRDKRRLNKEDIFPEVVLWGSDKRNSSEATGTVE